MTEAGKLGFREDFRRFFVRGLVTLLPTILTIVVLFKCYEFIQNNISIHIIEGVIRVVLFATDGYPKVNLEDIDKYKEQQGLPPDYPKVTSQDVDNYKKQQTLPENYPTLTPQDISNYAKEHNLKDLTEIEGELKNDIQRWKLLTGNEVRNWKLISGNEVRRWKLQQDWSRFPGALIGFIIAIILVYLLGRMLGSFLGRRMWQLFERTVQRIPGFKQVYPFVKQVTEFLIGEKKLEFSRVVAVPYPRKGIWSVGLVTGAGFRRVTDETKEDLLTIFIPSSPTPVTGYVIYVRKEEVIDLPITIEEALRFTASGGVIVPDHQALPTDRDKLIKGPLAPPPEELPPPAQAEASEAE